MRAPGSATPVMRYVRLMGPTAVGKTAVAVALRDHLPVELVSVDSAMVYREMDIGTGKPDARTLARAPHRLIDVRDPGETYSAADFAADARGAIAAITRAGRIPLLVGGTGLYFRALHAGLSPLPGADAAVRERIAAEAAALGWPHLHERLARIDPGAAVRVHPHDRQRIQRGLEIWELSGRAWTDLLAASPATRGVHDDVLSLVIAPRRRADLHRAIAHRFEAMLAAGLVDEVARLRARGDLHLGLASMRAVGYRQVWEFLAGWTSRADMVERAVVATRQLARRQLTWLRRERECVWVLVDGTCPGDPGAPSGAATIDTLRERFERWWERRPHGAPSG